MTKTKPEPPILLRRELLHTPCPVCGVIPDPSLDACPKTIYVTAFIDHELGYSGSRMWVENRNNGALWGAWICQHVISVNNVLSKQWKEHGI